MKEILPLIFISLSACTATSDKFHYDSSLASTVFEAQLKYLDNTLYSYSKISEVGAFYYTQGSVLEQRTENFKERVRSGQVISAKETQDFFDYFQSILKDYPLIDSELMEKIKGLPVKTVSDADLLQLYMKTYFVGILLNNKLLPFDTWSTMASAQNWTIQNGQVFKVDLATTACNSTDRNEWFLVKENKEGVLAKDNIIDTLFPDEFGIVTFETKNYKKGENRLLFVSKLKTPTDDNIVAKQVVFHVK